MYGGGLEKLTTLNIGLSYAYINNAIDYDELI